MTDLKIIDAFKEHKTLAAVSLHLGIAEQTTRKRMRRELNGAYRYLVDYALRVPVEFIRGSEKHALVPVELVDGLMRCSEVIRILEPTSEEEE